MRKFHKIKCVTGAPKSDKKENEFKKRIEQKGHGLNLPKFCYCYKFEI